MASNFAPNSDPTSEVALAAKIAALTERKESARHQPVLSDDSRQAVPQALASASHGWLWWLCHVSAWAAVLTLGGIAALRIFFHDGTYFLTWLNAFTRYVYLPAYGCLLWGAWQRRPILALLSLVIVTCHLVWIAPNFIRDRRFDLPQEMAATPSQAAPSVRIFFANVLNSNRAAQSMLQEIATADPDLVVVAEFGRYWHNAFKNSPVMAPYVHGVSWSRPQMPMVNIFSRLPLKNEMQNWVSNRLVRTVDVELGTQTLRVIGLHAPRPMYVPHYDYAGFWNQMLALLSTETLPLVVVGDFNATEHSLVYKHLRALGLRSAHDDRGRGYATTWPNGTLLLPPIRIDQAFLSAEVECERIMEGRGRGSDHKPLIIDVHIREPLRRAQLTPAAGT